MSLSRLSRLDLIVIAIVLILVVSTGVALILNQAGTPIEDTHIAFLRMDEDGELANVWFINPDNPNDSARQITSSGSGVLDYSVSPDGNRVAYTERRGDRTHIMLFDVTTNRASPLGECAQQNLSCANPVWRPDGQTIAYQREQPTDEFTGTTLFRIWLIEPEDNGNTFPLVQDETILGTAPQWSSDGTKLSFYDNSARGIWVYNFEAESNDGQALFLESLFPSSGAISPDGTQLVYGNYLPDVSFGEGFLEIADLINVQFNQLSEPSSDKDDQYVCWHPSGDFITVSRRYADYDRFTHGHQIYRINPATQEADILISEEDSAHDSFMWHPDGTQLVFQRQSEVDFGAQPQIWLYDLETDSESLLIGNGFAPAWVIP